jgi:UDP-N-acetylmuramate dehydrogenase
MAARDAFEAFLSEHRIESLRDEPLGPRTTFKIGGAADALVRPADETELADALGAARECDIPWRLLGAGANLLVGDAGVRGAVFSLGRLNRRTGLHVQAGCSLPQLVKETVDEGLAGLECLAGVPATVGGAIAMNAGGRHGDISRSIRYIDVLTPDGKLKRLPRAEIPFRYRSWGLAGHVAVAAAFDLTPDPQARARYDEILADKKATQPLGSPNAGCVFKNPAGNSAGRLIDQAGLKGARVGRAHVSRKHANFIVNEGGATARDVHGLIDTIRGRVRDRFGVELELEVLTW